MGARHAGAVAACARKYAGHWAKLEARAGGNCVTTGDQAAVQSALDAASANLATALGGGALGNLATCQADLAASQGKLSTCSADLATCQANSAAFPATGQTTCWDGAGTVIACAGTGQDGDVQAGATLAYVDNGDGTITDTNTKLMWEKLSDDTSIHDKDNTYTWADAVVVKIASLNSGGGFAGHTDWRVPNVKELQSIVNYEIPGPGPTVAPAFNAGCAPSCTVLACSCTRSNTYWSSSTYANGPAGAWLVHFGYGTVSANTKPNGFYVRAVRGGS